MGIVEWCWTDYPESQPPQRLGWLEARGRITCIDPDPTASSGWTTTRTRARLELRWIVEQNREASLEERQYLREWQECIDLMARVLNVPAGLIMKIEGDELTVHVSSNTEGNPYKVGDKEIFKNSGLYCERVIRHREKLCIPNALDDPEWDSNPDIKLGMIAYLGIPPACPNGDVFGTICILDSAENTVSGHHTDVMLQFKRLIEQGLKLIAEKRELEQAQQQIRTLRGIVPICAECNSIRDEGGSWHRMEAYMTRHRADCFGRAD